ncbi:MAG: leucine-rich repeat domain-containing protein [Propionicimonas sp.]
MRRWMSSVLGLGLVASLLVGAPAAAVADDPIVIPDKAFRACLTSELGLAKEAALTADDLARIDKVYCWDAGVKSLAGAEHLVKVTNLQLTNNRITDLSPLRNLTSLQALALHNNPLTSVAPLAKLTNLSSLEVGRARIGDLSPLSALVKLESLDVSENPFTSLKPLRSLTKLRFLQLHWTKAKDLSPLSALTRLEQLSLDGSQPDNLLPLASLTNLKRLNLSGFGFLDLTPLAKLTGLTGLDLGNRPISNIAPLAGLTGLEELELYTTKVRDPSPLYGLTRLTSLNLVNSQISPNIGWVKRFPALKLLGLENLGITDITPLAALTNLEYLYLARNRISDLTPLAKLSKLTYLSLQENRILDASPVGHVPVEGIFLTGQLVHLPGIRVGQPRPVAVITPQGKKLTLKTPSGGRHDGAALTFTKAGVYTSSWSSGQFAGKVVLAAGTARTLQGAKPRILGQDYWHEVWVGQTITADPGSWSPGTKLSYRWTCDGRKISGATKATYRVSASKVSCELRVKVTGRAPGATTATRTSAAVTVHGQLLASGQPRITGTAKVGSKLKAKLPSYVPSPTKLRYQWYRNGVAIKGATKSSYRLTKASLGKTITVRVRAERKGYARNTLLSFPTAVVVG